MKTQSSKSNVSIFSAALIATSFALTSCGGSQASGSDPNQAVDIENPNTAPAGTSTASIGTNTNTTSSLGSISSTTTSAAPTQLDAEGYTTCVSTDANHICIGLKIVAFEQNGIPTLTEAQAVTLVQGINTVWDQCNVGFQLEGYSAVDPSTKGLSYSPDWESDGSTVRSAFASTNQFVVIAVGSLSGSTIAVTEMPGGGPYGTLVEAAYAMNPLTVGHELGHYQDLVHVSDDTNLMNPYIGADTETLTSGQCATARSTDQADWQPMMRN